MNYICGMLTIIVVIGLGFWALCEMIKNDALILIPIIAAIVWLYIPPKR